jgi:hypothetical protein
MMKQWMLAVAVGFLFSATGCATLRGDKQKMTIDTDPSGANLTVDGKTYTTPAEVMLKRKEAHEVAITKQGYQPIHFNFTSTWDGASMTDLAVPGGSALMGASVVTGSDHQFNTLERIKLQKTTQPNPTPVEMFQYRGRLLTKGEYDQAMKAEQNDHTRFMGPDVN